MQDRRENCTTAEEFLLEPWVLLQLPFQPALLHQWAVALLAETLRFQQDMVTIFNIGFKQELSVEVHLLHEMIKKMLNGAMALLSIFCDFADGQENIRKRLGRVQEKLLKTVAEVTPLVQFTLSDNCKKVISSIKRASWSSGNQMQRKLSTLKSDADLGLFDVWYNVNFWERPEMPKKLFSEPNFPPEQFKENLQSACDEAIEQDFDESVLLLKDFVEEKIISSCVLMGASKAEILDVVEEVPEILLPPYMDYILNRM